MDAGLSRALEQPLPRSYVFPFQRDKRALGSAGEGERLDLRKDVSGGDVNDALGHLLRLLQRLASLHGATADMMNEIARLRGAVTRCTLPEDYEALAEGVMALELGTPIAEMADATSQQGMLREVIDAVLPIAEALRGEGPLLSLQRLRAELEAPRRDLQRELHGQLERLAEGVAFLRHISDVFKLSTLEMIQTLTQLGVGESGARQRLTRIRESLERTRDVGELEGLRQALLSETASLVAEATEREVRLHDVRRRVELAQSQVLHLEAALKDAHTMAQTDPLTGLGNRRAMEQVVAQLAKSSRKTAILAMDVDHFKRVNDTYGHDVGDLMLRKLAEVLVSALRTSDAVFRVGGEEFVAILANTEQADAHAAAERIRKQFASSPLHYADQEITATLSLGVTSWVAKETFSQALKRADSALYGAKHGGRNRVQAA